MAGRRWTKEELEELERMTSDKTSDAIGRILNRTPEAVRLKRGRSGIPCFENATDLLTAHQINVTYGIQPRTLKCWARMGLRIKKVGYRNTVTQGDLVKFMKDHPDAWDSRKIKDDTIFMNAPWFREKQKADRGTPTRRWTKAETSTLKIRYMQGVPIRQIALELGRTESMVKCKMHYMTSRGFRI